MVPRTAIAHRVLAGEQLRTTRLAHRHTEVGTVERQPLRSQSINVWRFRILPAEQRQIVVRAVIGHDDQKIRLLGRVHREPGNRKAHGNHWDNILPHLFSSFSFCLAAVSWAVLELDHCWCLCEN